MNSGIQVVPYDPAWPDIFQKEAALIQAALGSNCRTIHHVGSTSIKDMCAKPIIDMIPVVDDITKVDMAAANMVKLGYQAKGEGGMLFRRFFTKNKGNEAFNIHVYEADAGEVDRLLKFRDWMRQHPADATEYANLKLALAKQHPDNRLQYTMGKEKLIASIDTKTGFSGTRIVQVLTDREWETYHRIRQSEIADLIGIQYDPHHPTLTDPAHVHLVLYYGSNIVGVAQLERLSRNEAALRPFAIEKPYQHRGLGATFLASIERWLKQQDIKLLKLHANPAAVNFYERHGYIPMPFVEAHRTNTYEVVDMGKQL